MKVKHFAGYGSVNVRKLGREHTIEENGIYLLLEVRGNHEWGIKRDDIYDVVRWIGTKCDTKLTDYRQVTGMDIEEYWDDKKKEDVCRYHIYYIEKEN